MASTMRGIVGPRRFVQKKPRLSLYMFSKRYGGERESARGEGGFVIKYKTQ